MKKIIIYLMLVINIFATNSKVGDLLKGDGQKTTVTNQNLEKKSGKVLSLKGQAFLQKDGGKSWLQLVKNALVEEKVTIVTMDDSEISIKLDNDITVNIGAKTKLYIESLKSKPKSEAINEAGLKLLFGKVYSNINKKLETGAKYEIKSGSVVAGVRGTRFLVTNLQGGKVEIRVYEGFVVINNVVENKEYTIMKNQKVAIDDLGNTSDLEEMTGDELVEDLSLNDYSEEIEEIKKIINESQVLEDASSTLIKDIVNEGTWKLEPESEGNKIIINIE